MKSSTTYQLSVKFAALLFVTVLTFSNSASYFLWVAGTEPIPFEISDPLDGESEKESKIGEDIDDKIKVDFYTQDLQIAAQSLQLFHFFRLNSSHKLEIPTPPPEFTSSLT